METNREIKKKPRVLLVGPGLNVKGGITTVLNSYLDSVLANKVEFDFVPTMEDGSKIKKLLVAIKGYFLFLKLLNKCEIVHIHMAAQASFTRKSIFVKKAYKKKKKIIIHQHAGSFNSFFLKESSAKKQEKIKRIFSMAEKVIVLSEEWKDFFIQNNISSFEKIMVVHNGVEIPTKKEKDYSNKNVMFLGRLDEKKGIYDLIKAIPLILEKCPDAEFYFAGDGEMQKSQEMVKTLSLNDCVHFEGWITKNEKEALFGKCSVFILPTYFEAMPMSVLEAMSYGLATITTEVGGIPQIVQKGENGVFVTPGDIEGIAEVATKILLDEKAKRFIGENAIRKIEKDFSVDSVLESVYEIYQDLSLL